MGAEDVGDIRRSADDLSQRALRATKWSQAVQAESAELLDRSRAAAAQRQGGRLTRQRPDIAVEELWIRFAADGGCCSPAELERHLAGDDVLAPLEAAILQHVVAEILAERG